MNNNNNILQINFTDVTDENSLNDINQKINEVIQKHETFDDKILQGLDLSKHLYNQINEYVINNKENMTVAEVLFGIIFTFFSTVKLVYGEHFNISEEHKDRIISDIIQIINENELYAEDTLRCMSSALMNYMVFLIHYDDNENDDEKK